MKIFINGRNLNSIPTGISAYTYNLSYYLAQNKNYQIILLTNREIKIPRVKVKKSFLQNFGPLYDWFVFGLQAKGGVSFSPANSGCLLSFSDLKVSTIHDVSAYDRPSDFPILNRIMIKFSTAVALKFSDIVFTDSDFSKKRIESIFGQSKKVLVDYLGVNIKEEVYGLVPQVDKKIRRKDLLIVTNTTHFKRKNIKGLIQALNMSKYKSGLKLITTGIVIKDIKEDFVIQLGYLSRRELLQTIAKADLFVYPSFYEGFGLPVLEASLIGVNLLVSNAASLRELVYDNIITFDPFNPEDIVKKIDWFLGLPQGQKNNMKRLQRKFAKQFTWDKTARIFMNQLELSMDKGVSINDK